MVIESTESDALNLSWQGIGLAFVSAGGLCFEINLIRLFSVAQFYHFAFMVVSMALLGYGVSGTILAFRKQNNIEIRAAYLHLLAGGSGVCMLGSFLLVNKLPFDSFSIVLDPKQVGILMLHYAALSSPFIFSGMITSLMLQKFKTSSSRVYALNLGGSAVGCLIAVILPGIIDGEGIVALSAALTCLGGLFLIIKRRGDPKHSRRTATSHKILLMIILMLALLPLTLRILTGEMPTFFRMNISPYKSLSYALQNPQAEIISSQWNSISRIDLLSSPGLHSLPGLSYRYLDPLPASQGLFWDGDNLNAVLPADDPFPASEYLQTAIAFELRKDAHILIMEPRGGMSIKAALALGAEKILAVEENPLVIEAAKEIYSQPGVDTIVSSGRGFIRANKDQYDIIQLPLTDSYHPVSSGAYALGEDYRYTLEAFTGMIDRLSPNGILIITRWLQDTPSEWLRIFTLTLTALEKDGGIPSKNIIALRGYNTGTLLIKKSPFKMDEINAVRGFAHEKAFDIVMMPTLKEEEVNQFNVLPKPIYHLTFTEFLNASSRADFYQSYPYDIKPPTDDHPFFGHYFKWTQMDQILSQLGRTWQPFGGAGYLVIIIMFIIALIFSFGLILLPVIFNKQNLDKEKYTRIPLYFGMIGFGFMLVEMPLIQRFILYLDQPAYAMAVVLFAILLFSGLGSHLGSPKLSLSTALCLLIGNLAFYILFLPDLLQWTLGMPFVVRLGFSMVLIAPIGFLMGIPFPGGLGWISAVSQQFPARGEWLISYIWAINGACSVIAAILSSLIALSFGLTAAISVGLLSYMAAYLLSRKFPNLKRI